MRDKLILFPCNGNAKEALDCIDYKKYDLIGFVDDDNLKTGKKILGYKVFNRGLFDEFPNSKVLAVPGGPSNYKIRCEILNNLKLNKSRYISIHHPKASISKHAKIGLNCLFMEGVVIKANAEIGDNVCILPNSVIHHDSKIDDNCLIGSMVVVAGNVSVGKNCYIGSKSSIKNDLTISPNTLVGIGSNVVTNSIGNEIIYGNPAKS